MNLDMRLERWPVRSTGFSSRGSGFRSQYPHGDLPLQLQFQESNVLAWPPQIYRQVKHLYTFGLRERENTDGLGAYIGARTFA